MGSRTGMIGALAASMAIVFFACHTTAADSLPDGANGFFEVSWSAGAEWRPLAQVPAGKAMTDLGVGGIDIPAGDTLRLRVEKSGGGLAHLDSVTIGGRGPVSAGDSPARKLVATDLDVIDATGTVDMVFDTSGLRGDIPVNMNGRIEPTEIPKIPFRFPTANTYAEISEDSWFYRYDLNSGGDALKVDGDLRGESLGEPFFVQNFPVGSGHPEGDVYGWVSHDSENLYVAIDFTPDNTVDNGADYASVHVLTSDGVMTFTVSDSRTAHGRQGFVYTEAVTYQHMVYEFEIPLAQLGADGDHLELAFSAYGTAMPQTFYEIAYNPNANEYMVVYNRNDLVDDDIFGQLFDADGNPVGDEIEISTATGSQMMPNLAFDPTNDRYLVVWADYRDASSFELYGQMVNGDGTLVDHDLDTIPEPDEDNRLLEGEYSMNPDVLPDIELDEGNAQFLINYVEGSNYLVTLTVDLDCTPAASAVVLYPYTGWYTCTDLSIDPATGQALIVYGDDGEGIDLLTQLVGSTGAPIGTDSYVDWGDYDNAAAVAFSPELDSYLTIYAHSWDGEVRVRPYGSDGAVEADSWAIVTSADYTFGTDIFWEAPRDRFMYVWGEGENDWPPSDVIRANFMEIDAGPLDAGVEVTPYDGGVHHRPDLAYNSECANYAVAYGNDYGFGFDVAIVGGCVGITAGPASGPTTEAGGTATVPVVLNASPTRIVSIDVSSEDTDEITVDPASLTFTPANWSTPQDIAVTGVDDAVVDGDQTVNVILADAVSNDGAYDGMVISSVPVINQDNDAAAIVVSEISGPVSEDGTTATFTVVLQGEPAEDVTIGLSSDDEGEGTVAPASLTFTSANWNFVQTATVTGVDDDEVDGDQNFDIVTAAASSADTNFDGIDPADVAVVNGDNDLGPPTLDWLPGTTSGVLPGSGPAGTEFAFGVVYTSPDNRAPVQTDLHIDFDEDGSAPAAALGIIGSTGGKTLALLAFMVTAILLIFAAMRRVRALPALVAAALLLSMGVVSACGEEDDDHDIDASFCDGEEGETEIFQMVEVDASDTDYTDGKIYGVLVPVCLEGTFDYSFQFNDGFVDAIGDPASPHAFTVEAAQ